MFVVVDIVVNIESFSNITHLWFIIKVRERAMNSASLMCC